VNPYAVSWCQKALDQLAEIWVNASDRARVNDAVEAIDAALATDPFSSGTLDLAEGLRVVTIGPLRVIYSVDDNARAVDVATVRFVDAD